MRPFGVKIIDDAGMGMSVAAVGLAACEDAAMAGRAKDLAAELRPQFEANQRKLIRRRIAAVMDYMV
jgi:hypothetical protein